MPPTFNVLRQKLNQSGNGFWEFLALYMMNYFFLSDHNHISEYFNVLCINKFTSISYT